MTPSSRSSTKDRAKLVRQVLTDKGPLGTTRLSQLTHLSSSTLRYVVDWMESEKQVRVESTGPGRGHVRTVRLPHQNLPMESAQIGYPRFRQKARNKLGVEVSEELIARALEVYESGYQYGMIGLARHLNISPAEAIACIGQLRLAGKIVNRAEVFRAVVPHPAKGKQQAA